jgi:hypothetical protein
MFLVTTTFETVPERKDVRAHMFDGRDGVPLGADEALVGLLAPWTHVGPCQLVHELFHRNFTFNETLW